MKPPSERRAGNDAVLLWFACVVAICAGYYIAFGLLGTAIDQQHTQTGRVSEIALANAQLLAQRPQLQQEARVVDDRIRRLDLSADKPTTVARFIHAAARIVATRHVRLVQVDERASPTALAPPASPAPAPIGGEFAFDSIPLDVTLDGTYRELLATIIDLARAPVAMEIEIAAIERNTATTAGGTNTGLIARLHIVLQRLNDRRPPAPAIPWIPEDTTNHARPL